MKAVDRRICPVCGNKFSGAMEYCPICMLRKPLGGETEAGDSSAKAIPTHAPHRFEHYELMCDEDGKPIELGLGANGGNLQSARRGSSMSGGIESDQRKIPGRRIG